MSLSPAKRPPPAARVLALLLLAPALAGCGADPSRVLARVANRTLTADEFVEVARGNESQYPGPPDSAKTMLLQDMVRRALVLCDAERLGMWRDPAVSSSRERFTSEEALQALYRRLIPADVPVSEGEIERLYALRDTAVRARAILCATSGAAGAAAAEIAAGAPFAAIADRYGIPGALPPGGELGYLLPGALVQPLDRWLLAAPLMQVVGPIESPGEGWFLLQVTERAKRGQRPLAEQRAVLRDMLRQRKMQALRLRAQRTLREAYDLRLDPGGAPALHAFFNRASGAASERDAAPTDAERAVVLARYDAAGTPGTYTLGDAMTDLTDYGRERPNPAMLPSIRYWIEMQGFRRLAAIEARRRHLDQEPETVRRIERRVDNLVLDLYYDAEIAHGGDATNEDMREAYERNRELHQRLDAVELLVATLPDSATAAALVAHAGHAPTLHEAVAMAAPGTSVTAESVRFPDGGRWGAYRAVFTEMAPHECLDPFRVAGGWRVVQLVSKRQEAIALEALPADVVQSLRQQAEEIRRERTFHRKTDALRQEFRPEIRADRLRAIPWPITGSENPPG